MAKLYCFVNLLIEKMDMLMLDIGQPNNIDKFQSAMNRAREECLVYYNEVL